MTKKRNTCWSRSKKEKQILTARLIEISLKVEDHVYKHKLICVREAEQYKTEVSSYKVQCSRDERSLQVIEKLTRCMRAIILDHQELNQTINNGSSIPGGVVRAGSISPVYSIPDEDRTQFTQIAEGSNNNIEIIDLSNIDDDDSIHNGTNTATSDYAASKINVEVEIHRGMSILSLEDVGETLDETMFAEANCSQSILNNFEGVDQMQQNEINMTSQRAFAGGFVGNVTSNGKTINVKQAISNNSSDKIPNKITTSIIEANKNVKTTISQNSSIGMCNTKNNSKLNTIVLNNEPLKVTNATNHISSQICCRVTNNIPEGQRRTCDDSNSTCRINDSNLALKDAKHLTVVQTIRQVHNDVNQDTVKNASKLNVHIPTNTLNAADKKKQEKAIVNYRAPLKNNRPISKTAVNQENTVTTKKKRGPCKKKLTNGREIKPKTKREYRRKSKSNEDDTFTDLSKNKSIPIIYNENVVNDLSWMENIRYVREIKVDENDLKLNIDESFWDNYYLPASWSENEFV